MGVGLDYNTFIDQNDDGFIDLGVHGRILAPNVILHNEKCRDS
jgi:hypothetical protein